MTKIVDLPYLTYTVASVLKSGILVKYPQCNQLGFIQQQKNQVIFKCLNCTLSKSYDCTIYRYDVHNHCLNCGRYYRVDLDPISNSSFAKVYVNCPYCQFCMLGAVHKTPISFSYMATIKDGKEPFFGMELWFLTYYQGKAIWALNREHLNYLITYLSAKLIEKPLTGGAKTQADHLPTFIKIAKNKEPIIKLLKKLQTK